MQLCLLCPLLVATVYKTVEKQEVVNEVMKEQLKHDIATIITMESSYYSLHNDYFVNNHGSSCGEGLCRRNENHVVYGYKYTTGSGASDIHIPLSDDRTYLEINRIYCSDGFKSLQIKLQQGNLGLYLEYNPCVAPKPYWTDSNGNYIEGV